MDQVHVVRHKVLVEGVSARRVAREMGISRNTVKQYLGRAAPVRVEAAPRPRPVWEGVSARLEALLAESPQWTGGKQRLTAKRLHTMLVTEGFTVGYTMVKAAVAESKRRQREVFVPLVYPAGDLAEADFFEVLVDLADRSRPRASSRRCSRTSSSAALTPWPGRSTQRSRRASRCYSRSRHLRPPVRSSSGTRSPRCCATST